MTSARPPGIIASDCNGLSQTGFSLGEHDVLVGARTNGPGRVNRADGVRRSQASYRAKR